VEGEGVTMTAINHDDQLGEMYPTMLNELNCTFHVSFSRTHCYGRHGLWPSWYRLPVGTFQVYIFKRVRNIAYFFTDVSTKYFSPSAPGGAISAPSHNYAPPCRA